MSKRMKYELVHSDKLTINIDSTDEDSIMSEQDEDGHHHHGNIKHNHENKDDYGYTNE